jgi:hypothetical protein
VGRNAYLSSLPLGDARGIIMSAATRAVGIGAEQSHHADTPAAEAPAQRGSIILTRTLYVNVTGSLANLAMQGPSAGTWKLVDGKGIGVFGMGVEVDTQASLSPFMLFVSRA